MHSHRRYYAIPITEVVAALAWYMWNTNRENPGKWSARGILMLQLGVLAGVGLEIYLAQSVTVPTGDSEAQVYWVFATSEIIEFILFVVIARVWWEQV